MVLPDLHPAPSRRPSAPLQGVLRLPTRRGRVVILSGRFGTPSDFEWPSKVDRAISAGFDPHEPDTEPAAWVAREFEQSGYDTRLEWLAAGVEHAQMCGDHSTRCDTCGERLCAIDGPEPLPRCPDHPTCADCEGPIYCRECRLVLAEHANDKDDR